MKQILFIAILLLSSAGHSSPPKDSIIKQCLDRIAPRKASQIRHEESVQMNPQSMMNAVTSNIRLEDHEKKQLETHIKTFLSSDQWIRLLANSFFIRNKDGRDTIECIFAQEEARPTHVRIYIARRITDPNP